MFLSNFLDQYPLEWLINGALGIAVLLNGLLIEIRYPPVVRFNQNVLIWIDRYSGAMFLVSMGIFISVIGPWVEGMAREYGSDAGVSAQVDRVFGGNRLHLLQVAVYLFFFGLVSLFLSTVRKVRAKRVELSVTDQSIDASWYFGAVVFALSAISVLQFVLEFLSKSAA